ncbi:MAG TPA: hypothetical protein VHN98_01800 [Acidimicrobiales bacterium]|nr:hypothetical protein [Acidimicrobiales bacterium]
MSARTPWWAGMPDAAVELRCQGERHTVRWHAGQILAAAHGDADAEAALGALGGDPPACLDLLARWGRQAASVELVSLWRRPGEDLTGFAPAQVRPLVANASGPGASPAEQRRADLLVLLALPAAMVDRLLLAVLAATSERWADDAFRARHGLRLGAALAARAEPALGRFACDLVPPGHATVTASPAPPGERTHITARTAGSERIRVDAFLGLEWLGEVWARGVSEVEGRMVLAVRGADVARHALEVDLATWREAPGGGWACAAEHATIERQPEGGWRLAR